MIYWLWGRILFIILYLESLFHSKLTIYFKQLIFFSHTTHSIGIQCKFFLFFQSIWLKYIQTTYSPFDILSLSLAFYFIIEFYLVHQHSICMYVLYTLTIISSVLIIYWVNSSFHERYHRIKTFVILFWIVQNGYSSLNLMKRTRWTTKKKILVRNKFIT